jgi:hypothetical protein
MTKIFLTSEGVERIAVGVIIGLLIFLFSLISKWFNKDK